MSKIRSDQVALDTNDFIFGIRRDASYPACAVLLRDQIDLVSLFVPLRVQIELQNNLSDAEIHELYALVADARELFWNHAPGAPGASRKIRGSRREEGRRAHLCRARRSRRSVAGIREPSLPSRISDLPFMVVSAERALALLAEE